MENQSIFDRMNEVCGKYPNLNKFVNASLQSKEENGWCEPWPECVFLPFWFWASLVTGKTDDFTPSLKDAKITFGIFDICVFGTWRYLQNIYKFDDYLFNDIINTELKGDIPIDVLKRLPDYCVYIETNNKIEDWQDGFFAYFNGPSEDSLNFAFHVVSHKFKVSLPYFEFSVSTKQTLAQALYALQQITEEQAGNYGIDKNKLQNLIYNRENFSTVQKMLSLTLYLCSDKPDICNPREPGTSPHRPEPKKVKGGMKLFPAQKPTIWEVGRNIGQALRNAARQPVEYQGGTHASPKAHIRRGHWHGYWTGPRTGKREFTLKWLHPMLVNMAREAVE